MKQNFFHVDKYQYFIRKHLNTSEGSHSIDDFAPYHVSEKLKLSFFVKGEQFFLKVG